MKGTILDIQRFCVDDGPGIRTVVFLKGCPLRCLWCHNPESQACRPEVLYHAEKCIGCGACAAVCPQKCHQTGEGHAFARKACTACGACVAVCGSGALELCGAARTVDEVYAEIAKDKTFYDTSHGGVTVSSGEPLLQPRFLIALLKRCRENGIHTAIETSGFAAPAVWREVLSYCDTVLFDIKETEEGRHRAYTGVSLGPILQNLREMDESGLPFIIRAPIIPTLNDREDHFRTLQTWRVSLKSCRGVQLMPYHRLGVHKYDMLGRECACRAISEPEKDAVAAWETWFA